MHKGKKGAYSTITLSFIVASFVLASVSGIDLFRDTAQSLEGTLLEKNFIARDLAMTIEAIYASPGDIDFVYNLGNYRYKIDVAGGKVIAKDEKGEVAYRVIGVSAPDAKVKMGSFVTARVLDAKECKKPVSILLSKKFKNDGSSEVSVSGRNGILICRKVGENPEEGCGGKVVKCE